MVIEVKLFGVFEVAVGEPAATLPAAQWRAKHPRLLMQRLLLQPGMQMHRDQVMDLLWPDSDVEAAANRLYHTLHALRKLFEPYGIDPEQPVLQLQAGVVRLNPSHQIVIDACEFQALVAQARANRDEAAQAIQLEQAIALYGGDLLVNEPFEDWVARARESYKRDYLWALEHLAQRRRATDQGEQAIDLYKKLVEADPTNESAHRALMQLFEDAGHPERAMLQYIACKRYLERDLDVQPSSETEALADAINDREKQKRAQAQKDKAMATQDKPRYSAPAHAIALLGRDGDLATLLRWLEDDSVRLISIVGSAGLGKTRLVHALAERAQDRFNDGVIAIALTTLTEPEQLIGQLAVALGVTAQGETELAAVSKYLASRQLLLVLDRFEHILPAAQQLSALLTTAPHIRILVTTQALLRIPAERIYELPSLLHSDTAAATALFRAVAANLNVYFEDDPHVALIEQICEKLGGNALAIELAAAQTQLLTLPEILKGLELPLTLLTNPTLDVERQHRSLLDAIAWSHRLLDEDTKRIFAMLGVFASAFTLDDAAEVLKDFCSKAELTRAIQTLLDRHLIARSEHSTPSADGSTTLTLRFSFLDTVKQFAHEQLASGETAMDVEEAHAHYFSEMSHNLFRDLLYRRPIELLVVFSRLEKEADRALRYLRTVKRHDQQLRLSTAISGCLFMSGRFDAAAVCANAAVADVGFSTALEREYGAWCYLSLGRCASWLGRHHDGLSKVKKAAALVEGIDVDKQLVWRLTSHTATESLHLFEIEIARELLQTHLEQQHHNNVYGRRDLPGIYSVLAHLERFDGNYALSLSLVGEGLSVAIAVEDTLLSYILITAKANIVRNAGRLDHANELVNEALARYEPYVNDLFVALPSIAQFLLKLEQCDVAAANLALTRLRNYPIGSILAYRIIIDVFSDFLVFESGGAEKLQLPRDSSNDVSMLRDAVWGEIWILRWIYGIKIAARSNDWIAVSTGVAELVAMLEKLKNSLWYSWLFDACAFALIAKGEWHVADSLLEYSKRLIDAAGIDATPRQRRDWQHIEAAIESRRRATASTLTNVSSDGLTVVPLKRKAISMQWFGATAEALTRLQITMRKALSS